MKLSTGWLARWGMLLAAPTLFGTSCMVEAYRGIRGGFGDYFFDVGYYDDGCCGGWDGCCDDWDDDDFEDFVEDFFDDVLDWD